MGVGLLPALVSTVPGFLKPTRDPETDIGSLETEKRVHRIHDALGTRLHIILRSLVAPTSEASGLIDLGSWLEARGPTLMGHGQGTFARVTRAWGTAPKMFLFFCSRAFSEPRDMAMDHEA